METSIADIVARQPGATAWACVLALAYSELDRHDDARMLLEPFAACAFQNIPSDVARLRSLTALATVAARLRDAAGASLLEHLLAPHARHIDEVCGFGAATVVHYLGMLTTTLGRFDEADAHFTAASAAHTHIGAPTWLARTRLEWARMLFERRGHNDAKRARELLGEALTTARQLGLGSVERQAVILLRSDRDV